MRERPNQVEITNIKMSFPSMAVFMAKWAFAAIPAVILVALMWVAIVAAIGGVHHVLEARQARPATVDRPPMQCVDARRKCWRDCWRIYEQEARDPCSAGCVADYDDCLRDF